MYYSGVGATATPEMIPQFQAYKGSFPYKTDAKCRVNVVPAWRPAPGEVLNLMPSKSDGVPILKVLTNEAFEFRVQQIMEHIDSPKERATTKTKLVRLLREVGVNDQGKLLIPKDLAAFANVGPDTEVTLCAGDSHFEIWNRAEYERLHGLVAVEEEDDLLAIF